MSSLKDKKIRGSPDGFPPDWYVDKDVQDAVAELKDKIEKCCAFSDDGKLDFTEFCIIADKVFGVDEK